jgi:hypothetical protein
MRQQAAMRLTGAAFIAVAVLTGAWGTMPGVKSIFRIHRPAQTIRRPLRRTVHFEFGSITPGTYQARITPGLSSLPPIAILVGDRDIRGLEFTIPLSIVDVCLTVRTVVEGGAGIPPFQLHFKPVEPVSAVGLASKCAAPRSVSLAVIFS